MKVLIKMTISSDNLTRLSGNLWVVEASQKVMGFEFGTRMTVIRLRAGSLLLHSPIPINERLKEEIDAIGEVKYLVAPNRFHLLHIGSCLESYPEAQVWGAPRLPEKRKDIKFEGVIKRDTKFGKDGELQHLLFEGMPLMNEVVFYHPESRTLIVSDLLFNFPKDVSFGFGLFLRLFGLHGEPCLSWLERLFLIKDRNKARESAKKVLSLDFDRVVLAHRDIIPAGGKEIVRKAYSVI